MMSAAGNISLQSKPFINFEMFTIVILDLFWHDITKYKSASHENVKTMTLFTCYIKRDRTCVYDDMYRQVSLSLNSPFFPSLCPL